MLKRQQRLRESSEETQVSDGGSAAGEVEQKLLVNAAMHAMGSLTEADQQTLLSTYWDTAAAGSGATFRKRRERALRRLRETFRRLYGLD